MTRTLHKTTLQQHHTPTLQTSACKSVSAHLSTTNKGSQAGLDPFADLAQYLFTCRQDPLTSKAAEPSFFVVLADIRLVVPSHRGPQVLRSTDGSFSERVGEGSGWLLSCSGEGPWGPSQNQTPDSLDRKKLAVTAKFKPQTGPLGMVPELLCGPSPLRLIPTHLTIPEEAFPIDVSLGFTYF